MIKKILITQFMFLLVNVLTIPVLFSVEDQFVLQKTGHRKPPIIFNHKAHSEDYDTNCIDCHHKGKNLKCSKCHLKMHQGKVINIKGAFHQQCHNCHRKTSGPKGCGRCHKRTGK
ncbi:MAG: cytochrome c3 family protein [Spirochaetota bacterium]|nr:cytochrome c3 family protein [Spirochaetota bacterium]